MGFFFVLTVGLLAGTISGIVGTGSSIMLMPVLIYQYGPKEAVPIMAVAAVMANLSRILAWWREVDWRACLAYSITGIPAAALGARTLLALAVAHRRCCDRAVSDRDGAGAGPARPPSTESPSSGTWRSAALLSAISPASWFRPGR